MTDIKFVQVPEDMPRGDSLQQELQLFRTIYPKFIKEGDFCLDIGGNMGTATIAMSEIIGLSGRILTFEPNKNIFNYLQQNISINNIDNCSLYNVGCNNKDEIKHFGYNGANGGIMEGFSIKEERGPTNAHQLNCIDLNAFLSREQLPKLNFIKMDIEGWEYIVLKNIMPNLDKYKPTMLIEWWFHESKNDLLFDSIDYIGYNALNPDTFEAVSRKDFHTNKIQDLYLQPIK